ncbi:2-oxo acid dehydrogenase subunit E2 [Nocardioides sp.]|uniref:2-oxo acid dehydrogenase subunit E2 n=1 Tax=Nocardioides sp. TaxID=35761 RepID=UPI0026108608|nr:2-oxo acid dehydrogenase subunit E2 [Nocardioides sp.]MDI6908185.1 2-oxo acid dehydrogenase subunit E2 [Nocardioides sp.]
MRDEAPRRDCSCGQDPARERGFGGRSRSPTSGPGGSTRAPQILTPGESAILAFGAVRDLPWVANGDVVPRKVAHLAMSFDHRLVDGELGSRVLAEVGRLLNDPADAFLR